MRGLPSHPLLREPTRHGIVRRNERGQEAKLLCGVRRNFADNRNLQGFPDSLCDLPERYALFRDGMVGRASETFLQHQPEEAGCVQLVNSSPAVDPVANVGRLTFFRAVLMSIGTKPLRSFSPCTTGGKRTMPVRTPSDASLRMVHNAGLSASGSSGAGLTGCRGLALRDHGPAAQDRDPVDAGQSCESLDSEWSGAARRNVALDLRPEVQGEGRREPYGIPDAVVDAVSWAPPHRVRRADTFYSPWSWLRIRRCLRSMSSLGLQTMRESQLFKNAVFRLGAGRRCVAERAALEGIIALANP